MSLIGKIQTLFSDKERTTPVFPRTKVKAVSDDNGIGLDALLEEMNTATSNAQSTANTAQNTANNAMPKSGDTFTGDAVHFNNYRANVGSWYGSNTDHNAHLATVGEDGLISNISIDNNMGAFVQQWKDGQYIKGAKVMTDAGGAFTGNVYMHAGNRQGGNAVRGIWVGASNWTSVSTDEIQMIRK